MSNVMNAVLRLVCPKALIRLKAPSQLKALYRLKALFLLMALMLPVTASAQRQETGDVIQIREDSPERHVVERGDTLWDISARFLEDPLLWPRVWRVNPQIDNPDLIYPGDAVYLDYENGQPVLRVSRGNADGELPVIRLSPRVRREPLTGGIGEIALDEIASRLSDNRIVDEAELEDAGYLLGTRSGALLSGSGDIVYARGDWLAGVSSYDVVRPKQTYTLPATGEEVGVELSTVGQATIIALDDDVATLQIDQSRQEVRLSDRLLPRAAMPITSRFRPTQPGQAVEGPILGFEESLSVGGAGDTVVIGLGGRDGLEVGHLLRLQRKARELRDDRQRETLTIAGEKFGSVLVYRVFDRASLGLVMESNGQVSAEDRVNSE